MVLSAMSLSSSVALCCLQCDWLHLDFGGGDGGGCESSIGSVGTASASGSDGEMCRLSVCCCFSCQQP